MAYALESSRQRLRENIDQQQPPFFFVDKQVLQRCWSKISPLLKIDCLLPHLIGYGFLSSDDIFELNNPMVAPGRKKVVLYECVCASDERPHLLYMCICEDRGHLGHDEARELLEEKARELKKTPPAYLQQRGQPGDGDGGGGGGRGQRRENYREQRRNDGRRPQQVGEEGRGGQRRENYGEQRQNDDRQPQQIEDRDRGGQIREQRRNDNRQTQQVAQGDERVRNRQQNDDERREEEGAAGGQQPLAPPPSLPHAPHQETADAQEGSFVVQHGLPPSSAYVNIAQNMATANSDARGSRESQETETRRVQGEFADRPTAVGVQEQRERSSACANTVPPQSRPKLVKGNFRGRTAELDVTAPDEEIKRCTAESELVPTVQCCPTTRELSPTDKRIEINCSELMGQVVKMARTCDPTVEDKLRIRGVSMIRLGHHDYQTAQDLAKQVVQFVVASLNSRCSPTKGRSVLVAGIECSPSNHDLLITGLGRCEKDPNTLHRLVIEKLKDTIFVKSQDGRGESRYPCTDLTPHQVNVRLLRPCSESSCAQGRESNTEQAPSSSDQQQQGHVLIVCACPVLSLCTHKLFMVCQSGKFKVYKMSHDSICKVQLEHQIRELHNEIDSDLTTPTTDVTS